MIAILHVGCHKRPSADIHNACDLFSTQFDWYRYHHKSRLEHGVPIWLQLAIVHMESKFDPFAVPVKERKNGRIIKTWSSAQGYAQALDNSWKEYTQERPSWWRSRNYYKDSTDFIGWYLNKCHKYAGIPKNDPYKMYLCYHEGISGYKKGSYHKKKAIIDYAKKTDALARKYHQQLKKCENSIKLSHAYFL